MKFSNCGLCRLNQAYSLLPNSRCTDLPQLVFSRKSPLQTHSCAIRDKHTALHFVLLVSSAFLCLEILGNSAFHFKHVAKRTSPNYYMWPCNKRFNLFLSNFLAYSWHKNDLFKNSLSLKIPLLWVWYKVSNNSKEISFYYFPYF